MKFESGESTSHDFCTSSCVRKSRAHFHFVQCLGGDKCLEKINSAKAKHSDKKFKPFEDRVYDLVLCKFYWEN